jgi:hypothetical protein
MPAQFSFSFIKILISLQLLYSAAWPASQPITRLHDEWLFPTGKPAFVLLRRSPAPLAKQNEDIFIPADPAQDKVAAETAHLLENPERYPNFSLRLYQYVRNYLANTRPDAVHLQAVNEPAYLFLSDRQGGFPAHGFWLEKDGQQFDKRNIPFVDILVEPGEADPGQAGGLGQIYPHEMGHILLESLLGPVPGKASNAIHGITVKTDPWYGFNEGWAAHFEPAALDLIPNLTLTVPSSALAASQKFSSELEHGCRFCPANLSFITWQAKLEEYTRQIGIRNNLFARQIRLPKRLTDGSSSPDEALLYRDVLSPEPHNEFKNGAEMMASEGLIASFLYRITHDDRLQQAYQPADFYTPFLLPGQPFSAAPQEVFSPQENIYLKLFTVFAEDVTWNFNQTPLPLIQLVDAYAKRYPAEANLIYAQFLEVTDGRTIRNASGNDLSILLAGLRSGQLKTDQALGPNLWLLTREAPGGFGIYRYFSLLKPPFTFDLNTADAAELRMLPGITPELANAILKTRQARGYFSEVADLKDVPGMQPDLLERFTQMQTAMQAQLSSPVEDNPDMLSLLLVLLKGSYILAAFWQTILVVGSGCLAGLPSLTLACRGPIPTRLVKALKQSAGLSILALLLGLLLWQIAWPVTPLKLGALGLVIGLVFEGAKRWVSRTRPHPAVWQHLAGLLAWGMIFCLTGAAF